VATLTHSSWEILDACREGDFYGPTHAAESLLSDFNHPFAAGTTDDGHLRIATFDVSSVEGFEHSLYVATYARRANR
jgi:hypothetical protein